VISCACRALAHDAHLTRRNLAGEDGLAGGPSAHSLDYFIGSRK
jgi:hypothetical protein